LAIGAGLQSILITDLEPIIIHPEEKRESSRSEF
jgi:hypothetical protein